MTTTRYKSLQRVEVIWQQLLAPSTRSDAGDALENAGEAVAQQVVASGLCGRSARVTLMTFTLNVGIPASPIAHILRGYDRALKRLMSTQTVAHNRESTL